MKNTNLIALLIAAITVANISAGIIEGSGNVALGTVGPVFGGRNVQERMDDTRARKEENAARKEERKQEREDKEQELKAKKQERQARRNKSMNY